MEAGLSRNLQIQVALKGGQVSLFPTGNSHRDILIDVLNFFELGASGVRVIANAHNGIEEWNQALKYAAAEHISAEMCVDEDKTSIKTRFFQNLSVIIFKKVQ